VLLLGVLGTAAALCASLAQGREGFSQHPCSKARPDSHCTSPTEALPRGSQEKVNQRTLLKTGETETPKPPAGAGGRRQHVFACIERIFCILP